MCAEVPELVAGPRSVLGVAGGVALLACGMRASPRVALRVAPAPTPDRRVYGAARPHHAPPTLKLNVSVALLPDLLIVSLASFQISVVILLKRTLNPFTKFEIT